MEPNPCAFNPFVSSLFLIAKSMNIFSSNFSLLSCDSWNSTCSYLSLSTFLHFMFSLDNFICAHSLNIQIFISELQMQCSGLPGATGFLNSFKKKKTILGTWSQTVAFRLNQQAKNKKPSFDSQSLSRGKGLMMLSSKVSSPFTCEMGRGGC